MNAVQQAMDSGDTLRAGQLLDGQVPQEGEPDLRDFEWYYWQAQLKRGLLWEQGPDEPLESITMSHDGQWVAWGGEEGTVTLRHLETEETITIPKVISEEGGARTVFSLAFSPTENVLAIGRYDNRVSLWSVSEQREVLSFATQGAGIRALTFSDDGETLAAGTLDGTIELWTDLKTESHNVIQLTEHTIRSLDFSSDGERLIAVTIYTKERITGLHSVEVPSGKTLASWSKANHQVGICAKFSPDDAYVFFSSEGGSSVEKFDPETLAPLESIKLSTKSSPSTIATTRDGVRLLTGSRRGELITWNLQTAQEESWPGHLDHIMEIAVSADGTRMVTCSIDGWVRCWELGGAERSASVFSALETYPYYLMFSPDSRRIYLTERSDERVFDNTGFVLSAWDVEHRAFAWRKHVPRLGGSHLGFNSDGTVLFSAHAEGIVRFWDSKTGQMLEETVHHRANRFVAFVKSSPDGRFLVTTDSQLGDPPFTDELTEEIVVWDYPKRKVLYRWLAHGRKILPILFGPGEDELISYGWDKRIRRWRISTQEMLSEIKCGPKVIRSMHLLPDNNTLVATDADGVIWRWSLATNQLLGKLIQREGAVYNTALSPSGHVLAVPMGARKVGETNQEGFIKLIDTRTWEPKATLTTGNVTPICVDFSPDGQYLAAGDYLGRIHLWHAPRDKESLEP